MSEGSTRELLRALAYLGETPVESVGPRVALAAALELPEPPNAASYHDLFGFQLYPYASVYLGAEGMLGGETGARIEGFWSAVGREPPPEPDHLSSLLGLYASLREEGEDAATAGDHAAAALAARGGRALLELHLAPWVFSFLDGVMALDEGFYGLWAELLHGVLRDELARGGPPRSADEHLERIDTVPHPRDGGARGFLAALLAPARSGVVYTRVDLAEAAQELGLGLRAGERRYALEHMLAQDAPAVLAALGARAGRHAGLHEARVAWLGRPAELLTERARATERLLTQLAEDAREPVE